MKTSDTSAATSRRHQASPTIFREEPVPEHMRSLSTLRKLDYADLFVITGDFPRHPPERWAHLILEDSAGLLGQLVWRGLVWLRLQRTGDSIAGWTVAASTDEWILLRARGLQLTAELVIRTDPGRTSLATFIRYDRLIARASWPAVAVGHRVGVPLLLRRAYAAEPQAREAPPQAATTRA